MKKMLLRSTALLAMVAPVAANAQSTGSLDFNEDEIVVTGAWQRDVNGVEIPDTPKAKQVLSQEIIRAQRPGQTVNDIINLVPGVSFQNNDPWGSGGGSFTIRGFAADRVSQTLDGIPLNDSGNYAMYTNQQVDPEILQEVNVNLGTTDVDSPTASAVGGTVNLRTRLPNEVGSVMASASYGNVLASGSGDRPYHRLFGMFDTGNLTSSGLRAFFSASQTGYDNPFNNYGKNEKKQFNGRIYQPLGEMGDFISVAAHYNVNRNNFFGSQRFTGEGDTTDNFPDTKAERFYDIDYPCVVPGGNSGVADVPNYDCGMEFDRRYNPSNTGNIRGSSRFTLSDALVLTVDPSYQWVKANGGGDETLLEGRSDLGYTGFIGNKYYYGMDLNGDGDMLDEVNGNDPSQTKTSRYGVIASLAYEINPDHRVRIAYTLDHARHRQTGQTAVMRADGEIKTVFPIDDPQLTADGYALNKRNRKSFAILNQVSGEYAGNFGPLAVNLGLRAPFFKRELNQYCYTTSAAGYVDCLGTQDGTAYEEANPNAVPPISRTYKYDKLLPNVGFTLDVMDNSSVFFNYAKGLSVPGTDPLYNSLYFVDDENARPVPETTDSFDLGVRYQSGRVQAQLASYFTQYKDRLASSYNPLLDVATYRNLGKVNKWGIDGSIAYKPTQQSMLYVFGSWNDSEIKDDIQTGVDDMGNPTFIATGGKREGGAPSWSMGGRGQIEFGDFRLGAQVKYTGSRYLNDINSIKIDGYTLVDLDARYNVTDAIAVQVNVSNLFDELYVGSASNGLDTTSEYVQIGAPRAASISLIVGY
ncbi:TonB-dependent receptor [Altericroceibacterium endophyticum]|uniref:TonB-dependent receptor n=1 Tax=Altericroceibacterium endophyticum TaxID=1808508 RepID=A0A6I4T6K8_9SPHN|nr:TonB-dependent receptor [Altericroceibacterium endophyticum]MXO66556.1 TonB-dependent receptor [Altericroceibacterium endophyticum]